MGHDDNDPFTQTLIDEEVMRIQGLDRSPRFAAYIASSALPIRVDRLAKFLTDNPNLAAEALALVKIAGPWLEFGGVGRTHTHQARFSLSDPEMEVVGLHLDEVDEVWYDPSLPIGKAPTYDTLEEARAAKDREAIAAGWSLA